MNTKNQISELYAKYLNQKVSVEIDRPLDSLHPKYGFKYELNYGFVPGTLAPDGEEIDVYILGVGIPLEKFTGRCIAIIHRLNDDDDKLIIVPEGMELSDKKIMQATHFQEQFFQSVIIK